MQKRRERIEKWRAEKNKTKELLPINIAPPSKKWSLEDEDDDEEENVESGVKNEDDDEVDPLDAYMQVRCLFHGICRNKLNCSFSKVTDWVPSIEI